MSYNIGVDIGGMTIKSGIVNRDGDILFTDVISTQVKLGYKKILVNLAKSINNLIKKSNISIDQIKVIGLGVPGVANQDGFVYNATNLYWSKVPLGKFIKKHFPKQAVYVENDATIAGVAEKKFGGLKGVENGLILTLGTGIGGGMIINDKPYIGSHGLGSEIGHIIIGENNFYDCSCGNNGCFETYCSALAVSKYMHKLLKEGNKSSIIEYVSDIDQVTTKLIFQEYEKGDKLSIKAVNRFIDYFAKGIVSIINFVDPEIILIGGGLSKSYHLFESKLNEEIDRRMLHKNIARTKIKVASLGNDAGIVGASMLGEFN